MNGWNEVPALDELRAQGIRAFQKDAGRGRHLSAFVGFEPDSHGRRWWHLSISLRDNFSLETMPVCYEHLCDARRSLLKPTLLFAEMYPPLSEWQPGDETAHVRHLWQIPGELWD